jgi:hypothetical protein
MARSPNRLFLPTVGGPPQIVMLEDGGPKIADALGTFATRGCWVMAVGDEVLAGSPTLEYTHHVASYYDLRKFLPIVTEDAIYLRDGVRLSADVRSAYAFDKKWGAFTFHKVVNKSRPRASPNPPDCLWRTEANPPVFALIMAGRTLFAGHPGKAVAYDCRDGSELWSATVEGTVIDLGVAHGHLYVLTDTGQIICLAGEPQRSAATRARAARQGGQ